MRKHLAKLKQHAALILVATVMLCAAAAVPIHYYWRSQAPQVSVRNGLVLCRMKYCDFQFPMPNGATGVVIGPITVGPDTINGSLFVGSSWDEIAYKERLRRHKFELKPDSRMATSLDQPGGWIVPQADGRIYFAYFGDK